MLGTCTPKQSRRFFSQEAAAFCCIGFPFGGSCQWPRPLTDEGQVCHSHPFAGSYNKRAPHPALRGHLPQGGRLRLSKKVRSPLSPLCEGAPPAGGGGENCTAARNISGYGKVLSLRPFGKPPSQREVFRHAEPSPKGEGLSFTFTSFPVR